MLFQTQIKENIKLRVTGLCEGNSPITGEFPAQKASNAENVSIWWRHHAASWLYEISCDIGQRLYSTQLYLSPQLKASFYKQPLKIVLRTMYNTFIHYANFVSASATGGCR